ncbi:MAG: ABC transporter permease subunit [Flavobacteriales bacterium]|nr:ABC transporter permease subunit [Flavobacteriales bacterium]
MRLTWHIFKFVFLDNLRSIWSLIYALFLALSTYALIYFTGSFTRAIVSIMNIIILVAPLVSSMMMSMYYFNKTDFLHLMLAQPVRRSQVFLGMYLGVSITLTLSVLVGLLLGLLFSLQQIDAILPLITLMVCGGFLSMIFSALALLVSVASKDKLRGIGLTLFVWLFMAVIYDGLILIYFIVFSEYPIEQHAIVLSLLNPIDLSRIFIMLQLDISALLGYSGAVFQKFFGAGQGMLISAVSLVLWVLFPLLIMLRVARKRDL